jgi:hypothetical protein
MGTLRNRMVANTKKFVPSTSALGCFYLALTSHANARLQETFRAAKNFYLSQSEHHCRSRLYLPAALADEAADMECICIKPTPKPPTAPAINPITISKGMLSRNDFFFDFCIEYSPRLKLEITAS